MLQITSWHLTRLERLVIFTLVLVVFGLAGGSESGWSRTPRPFLYFFINTFAHCRDLEKK
jgi:hypothetical protein